MRIIRSGEVKARQRLNIGEWYMKPFYLSLFFLIALLVAGIDTAFAQNQPAPAVINDAEVKERISYIEKALFSQQLGAQVWWYGWISAYTAGATVQLSLAGTHWTDWEYDHHPLHTRKVKDQKFAQDMLVGGLTCVFGVGGKLVFPFKPAYLPDRLRSMPDGTQAERLAKLTAAEDILKQCAQTEEDGWGWLTHVLNLAVNMGAGLTVVYAFNRPWTDGLMAFAQGEAVSLLDIFTQPRFAIRDLKKYNAKYRGNQKGAGSDPYENELFFTLCPGGIMLGMKF
jgi:hypothetical protein